METNEVTVIDLYRYAKRELILYIRSLDNFGEDCNCLTDEEINDLYRDDSDQEEIEIKFLEGPKTYCLKCGGVRE